jgi:hypothetical protein
MDRHFLEFWGNFLLQAAKGQKQLEDLTKWSKQACINCGDFAALFRQVYGLEQPEQDSPDYQKIWKKAEEDFRKSFQDYLSLLSVVPREEYEELEEKLAEREKTIQQLRQLLSDKGLDLSVVTLEFQQLMEKQGEQFQELMQNFGEAFKESATKAE